MAALSDAQLAYLHVHLGTAADEDDAQDRYDRLGDLDAVVVEQLRLRLSDLEATPAQFSVSGEYSQSTAENIKSLNEKLKGFMLSGSANVAQVRLSRPDTPFFR